MRIDYIELKNYRPYVNQKIFFSSDEKNKNFTIIQGGNGAGKSNILNAITWCFYDEEIHLKDEQKGLPIFNTEVFDNLKKNETMEVRVEIQMIDRNGLKHNIIRSLKFRKNENEEEETLPYANSKEKDGSKFEYNRETETHQSESLFDVRFFLEQIMPENIKEYFFFDGERLNDYFRRSSGEKIRQAVFDISQISLIEKVVIRLKNRRRELLGEHKDMGPEINQKREELKTYQHSLDVQKEELKIKKYDKNKAEKLFNDISAELKNYPESADFENQRDQIRKNINDNEEQIKFLKEEKLLKLLKSARSIIAYDALNYSKKLIDKGIIEKKYPPAASKNFVNRLIKENYCCCGRPLDKNSRKNLENLLERISTASEITTEITKMQGIIGCMLDYIDSFDDEQIKLSKRIKELEDRVDESIKEEQKLTKKIGSSSKEIITTLNDRLQETKITTDELNYDIGKLENQIISAEKDISELSLKLTNMIKKQERFNVISNILDFLNSTIEFAEKIKEEIMQEVREKIQEKTKDQFFNLIWNPETFTDIIIDNDYNISVIHTSGRNSIGTLSAGQRQVLALSFMAALKQVSGFDMPIVIDTPLGRISKEPKNNIAKKLPNYLKGSQVTMLVTEEEYTPEVRSLLKERVQKEYRIILEKPTISRVVKYD